MKYPSGKTLTYNYGVSGSSDDIFSRYSGISDGAQALVQYAYNGAGTPIMTTYSQPDKNATESDSMSARGNMENLLNYGICILQLRSKLLLSPTLY